MNASIVDMNDHIDALEAQDMDDDPEEMLQKIASIRRNCLGLQRHMGPQHVALEAISVIASEVPEIVLGAGTVLDARQADMAVAAGARFLVSPGATPGLLAAMTSPKVL